MHSFRYFGLDFDNSKLWQGNRKCNKKIWKPSIFHFATHGFFYVEGLRKLHNIKNCDISTCGCLLFPILKKGLPKELNMIILRKFGTEIWTLGWKYFLKKLLEKEASISLLNKKLNEKNYIENNYTCGFLYTEICSSGFDKSQYCVFCYKPSYPPSQCKTFTNAGVRIDVLE